LQAVKAVVRAKICNTLIVNDELGGTLLKSWRQDEARAGSGRTIDPTRSG
jgi:hypothetical protein